MHERVGIPRPRRETHRLATTTKHREREDEDEHLRAAVQCRGDEVVVLDEELRVLLAQVEL